MQSSNFRTVEDKMNFPRNEEEILKFWEEIDAFQTQLKKTENCPKYTFYDGPPFATGLPHYGHLTAGTIKDVVTRYWTQMGRHVPRKFGWDCHGLPVEAIINKKLEIATKKDLMNLGIEKYNHECRSIVMTYANEWKWYTTRYGRWIDFNKDYKTLDLNFMESVWHIFSKIYEKGLVYRKCKVMPYSTACNTVLSNFEAGDNYKEVPDPSIIITLPLKSDHRKKLLAWTTTPWTLPSNLFLAVNPVLDYVLIKVDNDDEKQYILAESLLKQVATMLRIQDKYQILEKFKGESLKELEYEPLFNDFYERFYPKGCFRVYSADYVSAEDGTGIVHNAPGFGEDDYNVAIKYNLIDPDNPLCPIDDDGAFTAEFQLTEGKYFKDADEVIIENLKTRGRLLFRGSIVHNYPLCPRTNTPLIYKAIPSWFIRVTNLKEDLLNNNLKAYWVPSNVQEKRFHNWLTNARDWCFSRNRCWGNPIPLWVSDDFEEIVCVDSIAKLKELTGVTEITDLHREFIDKLTIPSKQGKGVLRRIEEVFDCWFESGSMPYAQIHYPFGEFNEKNFDEVYPADFIAEGIDQTRGWFYTLNVIATAIFNKNPYKNLIVNGLVLDENGEKMSKSKGNYPDPKEIMAEHGADAMRLYLTNSPLVRGQNLKFNVLGVKHVVRDVILPLYNSYRFLIQNIQRYESTTSQLFSFNHDILKSPDLNITDRWIVAYGQRLIKFVHEEMAGYRLYTVVAELLAFLDKLTNWYIRLNRSRFKGDFGEIDCLNTLNILFYTLLNLVVLLSPFIPFVTESIYQNLRNGLDSKSPLLEQSIHFLRIPNADESFIDYKIEELMKNMISVIETARLLREKKGISLKKPVASLQVINFNKEFLQNVKTMEGYIIDELNTNEIIYTEEEDKFIKLTAKPNYETLYKKSKDIKETVLMLKKEAQENHTIFNEEEYKIQEEEAKNETNNITAVIKTLNEQELRELIINKQIVKNGVTLVSDQVIIEKKFLPQYEKDKEFACLSNSECAIRINCTASEEIMNTYYCREIINRIQKLRKLTGINISDDIIVQYAFNDSLPSPHVKVACETMKENIVKVIRVPFVSEQPSDYSLHATQLFVIGGERDKKDENVEEKKENTNTTNSITATVSLETTTNSTYSITTTVQNEVTANQTEKVVEVKVTNDKNSGNEKKRVVKNENDKKSGKNEGNDKKQRPQKKKGEEVKEDEKKQFDPAENVVISIYLRK